MNATMFGSAVLSLLLLLASSAKSDTTLPLDNCGTVKYLNNSEIPGAILTDTEAIPGPDGFDVYAFSNPTSSLIISASDIGYDTVQAFEFDIQVNSYNQERILFQMPDALVVGQYGQNIRITSHPVSVYSGTTLIVTEFPVQLDVWYTVKVTIAQFLHPIFSKNYRVLVNGIEANKGGSKYNDFEISNTEFFSFDGGVSCLTYLKTDDGNGDVNNPACVDYVPDCEPSATAPTVDPVSPTLCDSLIDTACDSVPFTGSGFDSGDTYTCKIVNYEHHENAQLVPAETVEVAATFVSENQVVCEMPPGTDSAQVTLSSEQYGDLATGVVIQFNGKCLSCSADFSCTVTTDGNTCFIDGLCLDPYVIVNNNFSQICLPSEDPLGPSPRPTEDIDVQVNSCGKSEGVEFEAIEGGYITDEFALAAASFAINVNFAARLPCNSGAQTILLAEFAPGIKIYQLGDKIFMDLTFTDPQTGESETDQVEIAALPTAWNWSSQKPGKPCPFWDKSKKCFSKCQADNSECALVVSFRHNAETGETTLFVNGEDTGEDFGNTQGQQLLTTGSAFVSDAIATCFQIDNDVNYDDNECGDKHQMLKCMKFVCKGGKCRNSSNSSSEGDSKSNSKNGSGSNDDS